VLSLIKNEHPRAVNQRVERKAIKTDVCPRRGHKNLQHRSHLSHRRRTAKRDKNIKDAGEQRMKLIGYFNLAISLLILLFEIICVTDKGWFIFLSFLAGLNFFIFIYYLLKKGEKNER
jgi:hypothetical protein